MNSTATSTLAVFLPSTSHRSRSVAHRVRSHFEHGQICDRHFIYFPGVVLYSRELAVEDQIPNTMLRDSSAIGVGNGSFIMGLFPRDSPSPRAHRSFVQVFCLGAVQ